MSNDIDILALQKMLQDLSINLNIKKRKETFFDITRFPHYENVQSNILAYYFSSENGHEYYPYFFDALLDLLEIENKNYTYVKSTTEYPTNKNGRIDIVLESDNHVIGIENKIFHHLLNDLVDYREKIDQIAKKNSINDKKLCLLVLEKNKSTNTKNITAITHIDLWNKVFQNIPSYEHINDKHIMFFAEIRQNILNLTNKGFTMGKEQVDFLLNNNDKLQKIIQLKNEYENELKSIATLVHSRMLSLNEENRIFGKSGVVKVKNSLNLIDDYVSFYEIEVKDREIIAIDIVLSMDQNWEIYVFERASGKVSENLLDKIKQTATSTKYSYELKEYDKCNRAKLIGDKDEENLFEFARKLKECSL